MGQSMEQIYNNKSSKMKTRGHDGYINHVDNEIPESQCRRQKAYDSYAEAMKKLLLSEKQRRVAS